MTAPLAAALLTLAVALLINARETHLWRRQQSASEARIIAAVSPVESAADANVRAFESRGKSALR